MNAKILTAGLLLTMLSVANSALALSETEQREQIQKQQLAQVQHLPIPNLNDLTYHEARKKLMEAGWQPRIIFSNFSNPSADVKFGNASIFLEQGYGELRFCSGAGLGFCTFEFTDVYGNYLEVVTAGQEDPQEEIYAQVYSWRLYNLPYEERN
jgi:hypothetical protein